MHTCRRLLCAILVVLWFLVREIEAGWQNPNPHVIRRISEAVSFRVNKRYIWRVHPWTNKMVISLGKVGLRYITGFIIWQKTPWTMNVFRNCFHKYFMYNLNMYTQLSSYSLSVIALNVVNKVNWVLNMSSGLWHSVSFPVINSVAQHIIWHKWGGPWNTQKPYKCHNPNTLNSSLWHTEKKSF